MTDLLLNQSVFDALSAGQDPRRIAQDLREPLAHFEQLREKYLLYPDKP